MIASYDSTKKAVITVQGRGATRAGSQGVLRAFALSTAGKNRLGGVLWDLKYGPRNGPEAAKVAALLLLQAMPPHYERCATLTLVCAVALSEWLHDQCPKCTGRGRTGAGREVLVVKRETCRDCRGAGRIFSLSSRWAQYAGAGALVGNEIPAASAIERPCEPCFGKGWRETKATKNSRLRGCITCHGTGKRLWRDKHRALALRMTMHQFTLWKPRYAEALRQLRAFEAETAIRVDFRRGRGENPDVDIAANGGENSAITEGKALHSEAPGE